MDVEELYQAALVQHRYSLYLLTKMVQNLYKNINTDAAHLSGTSADYSLLEAVKLFMAAAGAPLPLEGVC